MKNIVVIGAGPAGMMAAYSAAQAGCRVDLIEKNEKTGKKLYITGKGRCNVTNASEIAEFFPKIVTNRKFLYHALYAFTNEDLMKLLAENGLTLKTERGNRVFPASDKSSDVIRTVQRMVERAGVKIHLNTEVLSVEKDEDAGLFTIRTKKLIPRGSAAGQEKSDPGKEKADPAEKTFTAQAVIVATGGRSYPSTGSTGDGYRIARDFGHSVTELSPALAAFVTKEAWVADLQGLSLKNIEVTIRNGKKKLYQEFGEMLFTHFGVSGPVILSGSSICAKALKEGPLSLSINLKPALSVEQLDARIERELAVNPKKHLKNVLQTMLPARLAAVFAALSGVGEEREAASLSAREREQIRDLLRNFPMTLTGLRGFEEAIITQGGVAVKEIDPATMESKKVPGLYFAGEVLDVDACTGGYNLQIAWSTGYTAGTAAGQDEEG